MYWANLLHIYQPPGQKKKIIDQVVRESYDRILSILESRKEIKISLNICASLTQQLFESGHGDVVERIKKLAENGRIELVASAAYHPILPLLPKVEIERQIRLNEEINQRYFDKAWQPKGFFLPEMAYNRKAGKIIKKSGYQWMILDEIAYQGNFGRMSFNKIYKLKSPFRFLKNKDFKIIFRNRSLSLLFFGNWLDSVDKFFSAVKKDRRSDKFLVTSFDGENLGHHRKHLAGLWSEILNNPEIKTVTYSEYLNLLKGIPSEKVNPLASSWATETKDLEKNVPYSLWRHPKNQLHQLQWQLTGLLIKAIKYCRNGSNCSEARNLLDRALASDQYWWASIKPWWNPGIIERGARNFVRIGRLLEKNINFRTKNRIEKTAQDIFNELERRKNSGRYKTIEKIGDWKE